MCGVGGMQIDRGQQKPSEKFCLIASPYRSQPVTARALTACTEFLPLTVYSSVVTLYTTCCNITKLCTSYTLYLCMPYYNKQPLLSYASLTACFYNRRWSCSLWGARWIVHYTLFAAWRKLLLASTSLSVRMEQLGCHLTDFHEI